MRFKNLVPGIVLLSLLFFVGAGVTFVTLSGCYCAPPTAEDDPNTDQLSIRTDDPLSGDIASDANLPYDRAAAVSAIRELDLIEPNLAGYTFALLFLFQNQFDSDIAFDTWVNFQQVGPRRLVQAGRQEVIIIGKDDVELTETALRAEGVATGDPNLAAIGNTRDFFGRPSPYIVEFRYFVSSDDHIIADQTFFMAPLNAPPPDGTQLEPVTKDDPPRRLLPTYECPAIIVLVIEKTRLRAIELDRELAVPDYSFEPQEPADPDEYLFEPVLSLLWYRDQVTVFEHFDRTFLFFGF